jgi:hypothetical protein
MSKLQGALSRQNIPPPLPDYIRKKVQTVFIGALSYFEEYFGELWGKGKRHDELTTEEFEMFKMWQSCRNAILNNSNRQLREIEKEIDRQLRDS